MVGGLLVSQVLTLFTTPVIYLYLDRVSAWIADRRPSETGGRDDGNKDELAQQAAE